MTMAVRPDYFVDDFGQKDHDGFAVFEIDDEGAVCGMVTGINHPTREDAEQEMAELSGSAMQATAVPPGRTTVRLFEADRQLVRNLCSDPKASLFEGGNVSAVVNSDNTISLRMAGLSYTNDWIFSSGMLHPSDTRTERSSDLLGHLDEPIDSEYDSDQIEYTNDVSGWWKETKEGSRYLLLVMTRHPKTSPRPQPIDGPIARDLPDLVGGNASASDQSLQSQVMQEISRSGKAGALMVVASRSPDSVRAIAGRMLGRPVPGASIAPYIVVGLPDGFNGHTANFVGEPVERDGNLVKLICADRGREYKIRWIADADLQSAIASQVANAKAWEYRDEKEGVSFQSLDRLPAEKREQWTSERPLDAVPVSLVGLDVRVSDQAEERVVKPRMRP